MSTLTMHELATESVELLPSRETLHWGHLSFNFNSATVMASNSSMALNVVTLGSLATSGAVQNIVIGQG